MQQQLQQALLTGATLASSAAFVTQWQKELLTVAQTQQRSESTLQEQRAINALATLVHTTRKIDTVSEEVARHLTDIRMQQLYAIPVTQGLSFPERFKQQWLYFRGNACNPEAKRLAHFSKINPSRQIIKSNCYEKVCCSRPNPCQSYSCLLAVGHVHYFV